jgi:hypothetical protein
MVIGQVMPNLRYVKPYIEVGHADAQVGFRLKRKETADLFDSEEMQAAFISVSN